MKIFVRFILLASIGTIFDFQSNIMAEQKDADKPCSSSLNEIDSAANSSTQKKFIITITDAHMAKIKEVEDNLKSIGVVVESSLKTIGVIIVSCDSAKVDEIKKIAGIGSVEPEGQAFAL